MTIEELKKHEEETEKAIKKEFEKANKKFNNTIKKHFNCEEVKNEKV